MSYLGKNCFVLDLDGTVYLGNNPIQGAVAFILSHWEDCDFYFLSNNTSKSPASYIKKLNSMGIPVTNRHLLSPTASIVEYLHKIGISSLYLVGNADYKATLMEAMPELQFVSEGAEAVLLAYDTEITYEKIKISAQLLQNKNVAYFATHPDLVCPDPAGALPDVGSFIALYEKAVGRLPERIFGKPSPDVLTPVLACYAKEEMAMVGDRLSTDKKLAECVGIDFVLVLSGEAKSEDLAREKLMPWRTVEDLGKL